MTCLLRLEAWREAGDRRAQRRGARWRARAGTRKPLPLRAAAATLGLPEIKLGLLPGAGGTQRLPRLVGVGDRLELMLGGAPLSAARALELGLVDRLIAEGDTLAGALAYARELVDAAARPGACATGRFRPPGSTRALCRPARAGGPRVAGLFAPGYIIECVEAAVQQPFDVALALSRRRFEECRESPASQSLRHLFFAERPPPGPRVPARPVSRVRSSVPARWGRGSRSRWQPPVTRSC